MTDRSDPRRCRRTLVSGDQSQWATGLDRAAHGRTVVGGDCRCAASCFAMSRWKRIREFFWPILEPKNEAFKASEKQRLTNDKTAITKLALSKSAGVALEEARRFADAEEDRRRVADQKATTYLAVVAALVPLVVTLATAVWDKKAGSAPTWVNMLMLGIAVAYASKAGLHAFRVLEVSASHRIGISDFAKADLLD